MFAGVGVAIEIHSPTSLKLPYTYMPMRMVCLTREAEDAPQTYIYPSESSAVKDLVSGKFYQVPKKNHVPSSRTELNDPSSWRDLELQRPCLHAPSRKSPLLG